MVKEEYDPSRPTANDNTQKMARFPREKVENVHAAVQQSCQVKSTYYMKMYFLGPSFINSKSLEWTI